MHLIALQLSEVSIYNELSSPKNELINLIDSDNFVSPDKSKLLQFIEVL